MTILPDSRRLSLFRGWEEATLPDGRVVWRQALPRPPIRGLLGIDAMGPGPYASGYRFPDQADRFRRAIDKAGWLARESLNGVIKPAAPAGQPQSTQQRTPITRNPTASATPATASPAPQSRQPRGNTSKHRWWEGAPLPGNVNWSFLNDREDFKTLGYVPRHKDGTPVGQSGATIGAGVDLGQQSEAELRAWGLDDAMIARLRPWLKGVRPRAHQLRDADQLQLTLEEAEDLTRRATTYGYNDIAQRYNRATDGKQRFEDLPQEMQTVVLSVAHQYGPNLAQRTPSFWGQVTRGDWKDAHDNLMNFHDVYSERRELEAGLLRDGLERESENLQRSAAR